MISLAGKWVHPHKGFELDAYTLARHLGRVIRFGGVVNTYYSVLQHSLLVADMCGATVMAMPDTWREVQPSRAALLGLLHDGHEFLTGDVPTDWKNAGLTMLQGDVDNKIYAALKVKTPNHLEGTLVKQCDHEALIVEGNYMSDACLELNPPRFLRPEIVEKWKEVFSHVACPDPYLAFKRNWDADGYYVKRFAELFARFAKLTQS